MTTYGFPRPEFEGDQARVKINVRLLLRSNSWVKPDKKTDRLLNHERGHFKIRKLCAREIEDTVNSTTFDCADYAQQISAVYRRIINKYRKSRSSTTPRPGTVTTRRGRRCGTKNWTTL